MLFLDMDGVLMDFNKAIVACGIENDGYYLLSPSEWTPEQRVLHGRIIRQLDEPDFWPSVQPMADAHELWSYCRPHHPHVLTAVLKEAKHPEWVKLCKRESIYRHFDPTFPMAERFHCCLKEEKRLWARKDHILVDDNYANCVDWHKHGGTAILHKDAKSTIKQLQEIIGAYV